MKNNAIHSRHKINFFLVIAIPLIIFLVSCAKSNAQQEPILIRPEPSPTIAITPTPKPATLTPTSTDTLPTAIPTKNSHWFDFLAKVDFMQEPAAVTTHEPPNSKYLYKYANVTFIIPFRDESRRYLNLDDLNDNDPDNSDVVLHHSVGTGGTFVELVPTNGATFYYSGLHSMSISSCLEHFPFTNMDSDIYRDQMYGIGSLKDYCILTDEGHLSILRYVQDVFIESDWEKIKMELVVTTYKQIVSQALPPLPTSTPGPSPTPGRYSGLNLTQKQQNVLDKNAQAFLDAVIAYDKDAVANLIEYPIALSYEDFKYPTYANNKAEFLAAYDSIFTHDIVEEFKNASLDKNMKISFINSFSIKVENCAIFFSPNGKIHQIGKTSYDWEQEKVN